MLCSELVKLAETRLESLWIIFFGVLESSIVLRPWLRKRVLLRLLLLRRGNVTKRLAVL
jgi:hypothetical protein